MGSVFQELKRRKVFRVAVVYVVAAWGLIRVADTIAPNPAIPDWAPSRVTVLLLLGFLLTVILAWAYDVAPDGVRSAAIELTAQGLTTASTHAII